MSALGHGSLSAEAHRPADPAEILGSVVRHRLLTARQVHELHLPGKSLRWAQEVLTNLARLGLVKHARLGRSEAAWYATDAGTRAVKGEVAGRAKCRSRVSPAAAAGPLRAHTLAINDVGLSFVRAARQLGHECHPADWEHEVALRVSDRAKAGQGSDMLVVDAVLHYTRRFAEGDEVMVRFVELDRGTETMQRLTAKLLAYRQLYAYRPKTGAGWRERYLVFPKVLVVLGGRLNPSQLVRRRTTFLQLADQAGVAESITAMVTTLPELESQGPFAPVFWTVGADAKAVDFAGEVPDPGVPAGPVDVNGRRGRQLRLVQPEPLTPPPRAHP
jgi:hypothetical protein